MRFQLVDRITQWDANKSLRAEKFLTLGEEYLADHFPRFPVMPGVLMLESLVESAAWLWRASHGFEPSIIALREVRNAKYGTFMQPGRRMDLSVEWIKHDGAMATFRGKGTNDAGEATVSAQFVLTGYNLAERGPAGVAADARLKAHWQERWAWLTGMLRPIAG